MIWLTWRQFRAQAITSAAVLAVLAIVLGATGPGLVTRYDQAGLNTCHATCASLTTKFADELKTGPYLAIFNGGTALMYLVPALIGIFWGAPLISREFETGSFRLAWNQSVTRTRWVLVKLSLIGLAAVAAAGLLSLAITWWASPIEHGGQGLPQLSPLVFGARGVAPLGYAAFAFALGVTAGVLIRRTVPAMAVTLVIFAGLQILMPTVVRPHLIPPVQATAPFNPNNVLENATISNGNGPQTMLLVGNYSGTPGAWTLSNQTITRSGRVFDGPPVPACGTNFVQQACNNWLTSLHLRQLVTYQPASRFWPLQGAETGIYLVLAAGLGWLSVWQVRRRRA